MRILHIRYFGLYRRIRRGNSVKTQPNGIARFQLVLRRIRGAGVIAAVSPFIDDRHLVEGLRGTWSAAERPLAVAVHQNFFVNVTNANVNEHPFRFSPAWRDGMTVEDHVNKRLFPSGFPFITNAR